MSIDSFIPNSARKASRKLIHIGKWAIAIVFYNFIIKKQGFPNSNKLIFLILKKKTFS